MNRIDRVRAEAVRRQVLGPDTEAKITSEALQIVNMVLNIVDKEVSDQMKWVREKERSSIVRYLRRIAKIEWVAEAIERNVHDNWD